MYHDQGQIALKLLSFVGGVTVQGGLPVVISTPAHGTAFDIVGRNIASPVSTQCAFDIAVQMAIRRLGAKSSRRGQSYETSLATEKAALEKLPQITIKAVSSCC